MREYNPSNIVSNIEQQQEESTNIAVDTLNWFLDGERVGNVYLREQAKITLADDLDISIEQANKAISATVGDIVDPVQQIVSSNKRFVGVIEYDEFKQHGAYGYIHHDDRVGNTKQVVCAKCVNEKHLDDEVMYIREDELGDGVEGWGNLIDVIESHYNSNHNGYPTHIKPGASLAEGTTISGNLSIHMGNSDKIVQPDPGINTQISFSSGPSISTPDNPFSDTVLTPSGKVILVPNENDNIGIYDPSDNSYTQGPQHGESKPAFSSGLLTQDGRVIFVPRQSSNIGIFDPSDNSYTSGPTHGEVTPAFRGGCVLNDGRMVFAPASSSNVGIFDPSNNSYTSGATVAADAALEFKGAVLDQNNRVIFSPSRYSNVGIYDASTDTFSDGPAHDAGNDPFSLPTLMQDGRILFAPYQQSSIYIFDPSNDSLTQGPELGSSVDFTRTNNAFLMNNGEVLFTPVFDEEFIIFDPDSETTYIAAENAKAVLGGSYISDDRIVFAPSDNTGSVQIVKTDRTV